MKQVTLDLLEKYKQLFLKISYMTENDIRNIWIKGDEDENVDLATIEYNYDIPLYQKMIFRFRNCQLSAPRFYHQIDPGNQRVMLLHFCKDELIELTLQLTCTKDNEIMEFLAWLANGLGIYDIVIIEFDNYNNELSDKSTFVKLWQKNQVEFFFGLTQDKQISLVKRYNKECVDSYNELQKDRYE